MTLAESSPVRGLAILLWGVDAREPERCATPFMHAAAAAALDLEVEVHFAARSVLLLRRGVADDLYAGAQRSRSILEFMRHARSHRARFLVCSASLEANDLLKADLIEEVDGFAGATTFVARVIDPAWRTLVF